LVELGGKQLGETKAEPGIHESAVPRRSIKKRINRRKKGRMFLCWRTARTGSRELAA
jgi:hypothetical protein